MKCIVSGTNRKDSNTLKLCYVIKDLYKNSPDSEDVSLIDLYKQVNWAELLGEQYQTPPESILNLAQKIKTSEGLIFIIPEYNGGVPGALKYFIDHLPVKGLFQEKPVCLIGLSEGLRGGLIPLEQITQILSYLGAYVHPMKIYLNHIKKRFSYDKIKDSTTELALKEQLQLFQKFTKIVHRV